MPFCLICIIYLSPSPPSLLFPPFIVTVSFSKHCLLVVCFFALIFLLCSVVRLVSLLQCCLTLQRGSKSTWQPALTLVLKLMLSWYCITEQTLHKALHNKRLFFHWTAHVATNMNKYHFFGHPSQKYIPDCTKTHTRAFTGEQIS